MQKISEFIDYNRFKSYLDNDSILNTISELDKYVKFKKGFFYVIAGRPGTFKTSLLIDLALIMARFESEKVYIFSFKHCKEELIKMMIPHLVDIPLTKVMHNAIDHNNDITKLKEAYEKLSVLSIYIDDTSRDLDYINDEIKKLDSGIVFIDGFEYMSVTDEEIGSHKKPFNKTNIHQRSNNSYYLKQVTIKNNIPIIITTYLSRKAERHEPLLKDLCEYGSLMHDADVVLFLQPDYQNNILDINIEKNVSGYLEKIKLKFHPKRHVIY